MRENSFFKNNPFLKRSLYMLLVVVIGILFYRYTEDKEIGEIFSISIDVLMPFIIGIVIAYVMNAPVRFIEKKLFAKAKLSDKIKRRLAIAIAFVILIGCVVWVIAYIIPEILLSIQNLLRTIRNFDMKSIESSLNEHIFSKQIFQNLNPEIINSIFSILEDTLKSLMDVVKYVPDMLNTVISSTMDFAYTLIDIIMGLVISIYTLASKERICEFFYKLTHIIFKPVKANKMVLIVKNANTTFEHFVVGKTIDSFIVGIIFFICCLIIKPEYPLMLSLVIGITNMIPYFGPFIGGIPVVILTLLTKPSVAIAMGIVIIVIQQFDGLYLGPKILGDSIGLNPLGVIFGIIVGGAIAGPLGMFFGVPIFAVILELIRSSIDNRYNFLVKKD